MPSGLPKPREDAPNGRADPMPAHRRVRMKSVAETLGASELAEEPMAVDMFGRAVHHR